MRVAVGILAFIAAAVVAFMAFCAAIIWVVNLSMHFAWPRQEFGYQGGGGNGPHYLFYSGFGSIILPPVITLAGLAALAWWHSQCHVTGCFWPSRRKTAAGEKTCWRHSPHPRRTFEDICHEHHLYLGKQPGRG